MQANSCVLLTSCKLTKSPKCHICLIYLSVGECNSNIIKQKIVKLDQF